MPTLREQMLRQRGMRRTTKPTSIAAPLKGWNTRDPYEAMDPQDAILLDNWYPDFGGLKSRTGSANFKLVTNAFPVRTLAAFRTSDFNLFLAACGGSILEISGAIVSPVGLNFASDTWDTAVFQNRQFWANGVDPVQSYDGTTMVPAAFTGVNTSTLAGVGAFHQRLFFWTGHDPSFWYGPVNGIAGALSNFSLSTVQSEGGNLIAVEVLSYDGGTGINDYTCFFMSSGEVLIYTGTDPSNAANWALSGRYQLPPLVTPRALTRYGGDIYMTTANDHQQLSKYLIALKLGETPPQTKATGAVQRAYQLGKSLPGWQSIYYPAGTRIIHNIPNTNNTYSQHVFNTSTQAWCRFRGMNALCWGLYNDKLYFGTSDGHVVQADTGSTDNGAAILSQSQQAWQMFDSPLFKRIALVRPIVQSNGLADFNFGLGFDYQEPSISIPDETLPLGNALVFGATSWGAPHVWGGLGVTDPRWHIAGGEGGAIGLSLNANTQIGAAWIRTDFQVEFGTQI